ncbi:hypothetical protein Ccrd_014937 [Cynara cardunculus var. scolymus]|uniref:ZCF37 n=1 Tax=Cynara cardunculus var. scolymus TaxID=59895 RepID=A0A118K3Y4_CYNCS|nr:hypothetical protein Ccrd_014937 [Cynara cardunculus var. scolymus]
MAFICGSFHRQDQEDAYEVLWPFPSTSPKRRHVFSCRTSKNSTNPYADRGLDKFEALLSDLDHKRQKILTQKGSEDVSMVKFVYRSPHEEVTPIVIKLRHQRKHNKTSLSQTQEPKQHQKDVAFAPDKYGGNGIDEGKRGKPALVDGKSKMIKKIKCDEWGRKVREWWKPSCYLALFVILILVLLMFLGRSFAILCTSLGWYLVPIINETLHVQSSRRRSRSKSNEKANNKQTKR